MALYDNNYSRAVAWLKVLLPILALAILSTLFLLSRTIEPSQTLPYANVDAQEFAREQRIGAPNYSGIASNGAAVTVIADSARPDLDNPDIFIAVNVDALIKQADGTTLGVKSAAGKFDTNDELAVMTGGVELTSSNGYRMTSDTLQAQMDGSAAETDTPVVIDGPQNRIEAGNMRLRLKDPDQKTGGYVVDFNGGVKLIYTPKETKGSP